MTPTPPDLSKLRIDRQKFPSEEVNDAGWQRKPILTIIVGILLVIIAIFYFRNPAEQSARQATEATPEPIAQNNPPVTSESVLNATGYVVAQRKAAVSSKATGRLRELRVVEGDRVKAGDVIGILENDDLAAVVRGQEATLASVKGELNVALAELSVAVIDRDRKISMQRSSASSESDRDNAVARHQKAVAQAESARANVAVAQAQLDKAQVDFEYTLIHAPFAGTVLTKNADVGEIVAPFGSSADARAAVVTIADMSSMQVEADISESNIARVFVGQAVSITLDSFPGKTYQGVVDKIVPTVDRAKATVMVKIRFAELDEHVLPEMSAKVALTLKTS